ncbi:hypothetical protein BV898_04435 [Hypsibius exemplaris]|uniref:Uncharacterized protein n=1 Tax=Hypsibius exemplaris TaxID=2072580 RepID=A0A1W0X235_HYPEX|nr:hypothetical protein BV898_04435 [Hypsibius exemplaris]
MVYDNYGTDYLLYVWVCVGIFAIIMALIGILLCLRRRRIILAQHARAGIIYASPHLQPGGYPQYPTAVVGMADQGYQPQTYPQYPAPPPQYSAFPAQQQQQQQQYPTNGAFQ